jgi:hypothetical protein
MAKKMFTLAMVLATCSATSAFSTPTPDAMRAASAVQRNSQLATSLNLTKDANANIVSFHVNGINPDDATTLLTQSPNPLSSEYTVITGKNRDGSSCCFMLPTSIATPSVVESISKDLVNAGAAIIDITKQRTGKP